MTPEGRGLTERDIADGERKIGLSLPDDYKTFLLASNGAESGDDRVWCTRGKRRTSRHAPVLWPFRSRYPGDPNPIVEEMFPEMRTTIPPGCIPIGTCEPYCVLYLRCEQPRASEVRAQFMDEVDVVIDWDDLWVCARTFEAFLAALAGPPPRAE